MRQSRFYTLLCLGLAAGLFSCLNPHRVRMADTDPDGWSPADGTTVAYENTDTLSARDISVVVRFCNDFNYDKLALSLVTVTPDGYRWCDTLYMDVYGRLPKVGLYGEREQPYRRGVVFTQTGRYLFSLAPVMPASPTEGVAAAGIRLEPASAPQRALPGPAGPADTSRLTR